MLIITLCCACLLASVAEMGGVVWPGGELCNFCNLMSPFKSLIAWERIELRNPSFLTRIHIGCSAVFLKGKGPGGCARLALTYCCAVSHWWALDPSLSYCKWLWRIHVVPFSFVSLCTSVPQC